jgi:hypothetical protein
VAGALEAQIHRIIVVQGHELDISAVCLETWPNILDCLFDLIFEGLFSIGFATATFFAHKNTPIFLFSGGIISRSRRKARHFSTIRRETCFSVESKKTCLPADKLPKVVDIGAFSL